MYVFRGLRIAILLRKHMVWKTEEVQAFATGHSVCPWHRRFIVVWLAVFSVVNIEHRLFRNFCWVNNSVCVSVSARVFRLSLLGRRTAVRCCRRLMA